MKITFKHYQNGDTLNVTKYLWLPKFLWNEHGELSIRWLEYATIKYVYCNCLYLDQWPHWKAVKFIDGDTNG